MGSQKEIFSGKIALVTGAGSGIGRATALEFAKKGANVVAVDLHESDAVNTCKMIDEIGPKTLMVRCNVSHENEIKQLFKKIFDTFHRLDYAFNNAGIEGEQAPTANCTEENWDRVLDTNLKGLW